MIKVYRMLTDCISTFVPIKGQQRLGFAPTIFQKHEGCAELSAFPVFMSLLQVDEQCKINTFSNGFHCVYLRSGVVLKQLNSS